MRINNETNIKNINYLRFMENENEKQKSSSRESEPRQSENMKK